MTIAIAVTMLVAAIVGLGALVAFELMRRHLMCLKLEDGLRREAELV
jgi:hypothetical protein